MVKNSLVMLGVAIGLSCNQVEAQTNGQQPSVQHMNAEQTQEQVRIILAKIPGLHFAESVPANFPVPQYPKNVTRTNFSNSTKGQPSAAATIITKDPPETVYNWYKDALAKADWTVKIPTAKALAQLNKKSGQIYMLDTNKDKQKVSVFFIPDKKTKGTMIDISWLKTK